MPFSCAKCGLCCKNISNIAQLRPFDTGNGVCVYLRGNLCAIYEKRPEICRVDAMYETRFAAVMSKDDYYRLNHAGCKLLQENTKHEQNER